jgi:hypothetical protein
MAAGESVVKAASDRRAARTPRQWGSGRTPGRCLLLALQDAAEANDEHTPGETIRGCGSQLGLRGRFLRWRQGYAYESDALGVHTDALGNGRHVMYLPVKDDRERQRVVEELR